MRNLQVTLLPKPAFKAIVDSKKDTTKATLLLILQQVETRFDNYNSNRFNLEVLTASPYRTKTPDHKCLISCYTGETKKRNEVIGHIKENQPSDLKGICQYCCINSPDTIDHYLPKDTFPEFSVFTLNLIPCCNRCNSKKGEYLKDSNGIREIINFYFDDFLDSRFLFCNVNIVGTEPVVDFYLQNTAGLNSNIYRVIENHFSRLDLLNRYKGNMNGVISEIKNTCETLISLDNKEKIRGFLIETSERNRRTFGINYWKAVLMEGLANCQNYINLL